MVFTLYAMQRLLLFLVLLVPIVSWAQTKVTINPTISPSSFKPSDEITVTYDVTGTTLASLTNAWAWVWIPGKNIDARYNLNPATTGADPAKFTKVVEAGKTLFRITFKPQDFFVQPICLETQLGILIKASDWGGGQSTDFVGPMTPLASCFIVELSSPMANPVFVNPEDNLLVEAESSEISTFTLSVAGVQVDQQVSIKDYSFSYSIPQSSGIYDVSLAVGNAENDSTITFKYIISTPSLAAPRPAGIIPGINYHDDPTKATLCLLAPLKTSVYVRGDFTNWEILHDNKMKRDGEYFWIELTGLTAGEEYAFQYLVDENIWIADPYADKILDPEDQYIPTSTYPGLKQFPPQALKSDWYLNRVAVLQTAQTPYEWQVTNFEKPAKEKLVVYELLIRDFFGSNNRNYQNLIDTLSYFESLGVNAIELMPIMEFNGNEGWGYNPTFMLAPDKYYGTKNKLKEFIDEAHKRGIAVILDIALNHQDLPNPYALMYFEFGADGEYGKPTANNPWFNRNPTHPFNVFYDMNHESAYTKAYVDTVNHYWLSEYKVDGFRFDLSKGFTQTNNPNNVGAWGNKDDSRIAILTRMADKIWSSHPDAYIILEHFADNPEEKILAEYRANEGKGMMLWGNLNHAFNENTMGYASDVSWILHNNRGWSVPHVVGYMESHDEERLMYKNLMFGNVLGSYSTKDRATALNRIKAAHTLFYSLPGPKMLWQFGELGYDKSINTCTDGSVNPPGPEGGEGDCRLSAKPLPWSYLEDFQHASLFKHTADLLRLRNTYPVFTTGTATLASSTSLVKQATVRGNPYTPTPTNENEMNVQVVVNFELANANAGVNFPHTGTWYDYYAYGQTLNVTSTNQTISLKPGEYKIYTDYPIENLITGIDDEYSLESSIVVYPNPSKGSFSVQLEEPVLSLQLLGMGGKRITPGKLDDTTWSVDGISSGLYIVEIQTPKRIVRTKLIKE